MADTYRIQPGYGFVLNDEGTWDVAKVPDAVIRDSTYSGELNILGYSCLVFDTPDGSTWAQKIPAVDVEKIARRIARLS